MKDIVRKIAIWFFSVIICGVFVGLMGNRVYYEYFERSNLAYSRNTFRLASKDSNLKGKLKITINDKNVNELYITTLSIINNGNGIISRDDQRAESDPVRIEGRNIESVFVDKINTTANSKVTLTRRKRRTLVNFKWMNPGDAIVLKVVHHRPGDNIRVRGSFRGISKISYIDNEMEARGAAPDALRIICMTVLGIGGLVALLFCLFALAHRIKYGCWYMSCHQRVVFYMITRIRKLSSREKAAIRRRVCKIKDCDALDKMFMDYREKWKA